MTYLHESLCGYRVTSTTTYAEAVTLARKVGKPVWGVCPA